MKKTEDLKKYYNRHNMIIFLSVFFACSGACIFTPKLLMPKPRVDLLIPEIIMENSSFNDNNVITLEGNDLNNVVGVYINGIWESGCAIVSEEEDCVQIILPSEYYREDQVLEIQVQTKINSDLFAMSNKKKFTVLSNSDIKKPKVKVIEPNSLYFNKSIIQKITLSGENFNNNSVVTINNFTMQTFYDDGTLTAFVPFSIWYKADELRLNVVQYYDGYATSIKSSPIYLQFNPYIIEANSFEEFKQQNHQFMLKYLGALRNDNYLVIFSVKDEASSAMTEEINSALRCLGMKEVILETGYQKSYIAVLDSLELIYEEIGTEVLVYDDEWNDLAIHVESANCNAGNFSIIQLDGIEYSANGTGLNIVIYDKKEGRVIDSVCFDTSGDLSLKK